VEGRKRSAVLSLGLSFGLSYFLIPVCNVADQSSRALPFRSPLIPDSRVLSRSLTVIDLALLIDLAFLESRLIGNVHLTAV
jgi:hypothetical protein